MVLGEESDCCAKLAADGTDGGVARRVSWH